MVEKIQEYIDKNSLSGKDVFRLLWPVIEAADPLLRQNYGNNKSWAGMWSKCECGRAWAFGGNWNECQPTDSCPMCKMTNALRELKRKLEVGGER